MTRDTDKQHLREILEAHPGEWISELDLAMELDIELGKVQFLVMRMRDVMENYEDGMLYCKLQPNWSKCWK